MPEPAAAMQNVAEDLEILDTEQNPIEHNITEIVKGHRDVVEGITQAARRAFEVGLRFIALKDMAPHGEFLGLVERTGIPRRTAQHYMARTREVLASLEATSSATFALLETEALLGKLPRLWTTHWWREDFRESLTGKLLSQTAEAIEVTRPRQTPTRKARQALAALGGNPTSGQLADLYARQLLTKLYDLENHLPNMSEDASDQVRARFSEIFDLMLHQDDES